MSLTAEPDAADPLCLVVECSWGVLLPFLDLGEGAPTYRGGWDCSELKQKRQEGKTRGTDKLCRVLADVGRALGL